MRNFVVEHSGANRGHLVHGAGGLVPIASLSRWIAVVTGDDRGSNLTRLWRGEAAELLTSDETETLVRAFEYRCGLILGRDRGHQGQHRRDDVSRAAPTGYAHPPVSA
nr:putative nucleotidyltransferase substrate binding domain-containing protein [Rhodococcus wratislaviensis]GLK35830.1 hypothetical protein GCM10017611_26870 [Rhodococcus wratislaviensis]